MANLLWNDIAPGNAHDARNPFNWELVTPGASNAPPDLPAPGDSLYMAGGTMNLVSNNLAGDTLNLSTLAPASLGIASTSANPVHHASTINLLNSAISLFSAWNNDLDNTNIATVNAYGFDFVTYGSNSSASAISDYVKRIGTTFNVAAHSTLSGSYTVGQADSITVNGPGKFAPSSVALGDGTNATINADVVGSGTFTAGGYHPPQLTFGGAVSGGDTINLDSAFLIIDTPTAFHATVNASVSAYHDTIDLVGLTGADSYSLNNDMLTITSHGHTIDSLHLIAGSFASQIGVYQTASGVELDYGYASSSALAGVALTHTA